MEYNIHIEVAVLIIFVIILIIQSIKKTLPTRSIKKFFYLLYVTLFVSVMSIFLGLSNQMHFFQVGIAHTINIVYYMSCCLLIAVYIEFIAAIVLIQWNKWIRFLLIDVLPAFMMCIIISNPWTGFSFRIDENGVFKNEPLFYAIFIVFIIYVLGFALFIQLRTDNHTDKKVVFITISNIAFVVAMAQPLFCKISFNLVPVAVEVGVFLYLLSQPGVDFYIDSGTGQFNFAGFSYVLNERIASQTETSCFIVRVRNYTAMSKLHGREQLHRIQQLIAEILEINVDSSRIFHVGSAAYAIVLDTDDEVREVYRRLKECLPFQWYIKKEAILHEYSFYRVSYPEDSDNMEEIMQRIHYARSDHKGHHEPGALIHLQHQALKEADERKKVAHLIEDAILNNTLEINFQPIYSFEADRITSLEVLSRLKDEDKKYINPEFFIHVAEDNHTIKALSLQMFDKACSFAVRNNIFELGVTDININLSPTHCCEKESAQELLDIAKMYNIPPHNLHFEITESKLTDNEQVRKTLQILKDAGAKIALDDFGTGYSNLSSIQELPIDFVKIDKSLVWSYSNGDNRFLTELLPMIKAEGKKIIAEGIETEEHIEILREMCGDFLQGYFYSKPLPEMQFIRFLKEFNQKQYT